MDASVAAQIRELHRRREDIIEVICRTGSAIRNSPKGLSYTWYTQYRSVQQNEWIERICKGPAADSRVTGVNTIHATLPSLPRLFHRGDDFYVTVHCSCRSNDRLANASRCERATSKFAISLERRSRNDLRLFCSLPVKQGHLFDATPRLYRKMNHPFPATRQSPLFVVQTAFESDYKKTAAKPTLDAKRSSATGAAWLCSSSTLAPLGNTPLAALLGLV